jgi:ketosteroid isomerase-like protein
VSRANVEAVRRAHAAFQRRELGAIAELVDPEIEWHEPTGAVRRGHEELLGSWQLRGGRVVWGRDYVDTAKEAGALAPSG